MIQWRMARRAAVLSAFFMIPMVSAALSQTTGAAPAAAQITGPGIGLTPDHKRTIYREVGKDKPQKVPEDSTVAIGSEVPNSLMLNEMPVSVKDQIGLLRDFKFAKLADENILIVDPAKRQVVDIVTKSEGSAE